MRLLRHAATPLAPIQRPPPQPSCFFTHYLYSAPSQGRQRGQQQPFHSTSHLRDEHIDNAQNHYETLKLQPSATPAEIKKSFYTLSKRHHPDHNAGDRERSSRRFMRISEAYSVLSVPAKRHAYDRDTLQLHRDPHAAHGRRSGSYHSTNPAGGRPATGLSRRRGAFQGPPPSFFRSGGWGAHGAKRRAAHEDSTGGGGGTGTGSGHGHGHGHHHHGAGTTGGMGPGQDPFRHRDREVPHFDRAGHERTGRHGDARRAARYHEQEQHGQAVVDEHGRRVPVGTPAPERGVAGMFFVIGGVLLVSFLGPFAVSRFWSSGGGSGGGKTPAKRKNTRTAAPDG
ncbi:hypothetical protein DL764_002350 [Monosporascus ibericus]|uniref:J domain-containing protein n=1 Tax=Monosporascus ibericus TaxID=155417 RepID=A0A4Q4TKV0_9PEZI|nr:hypothetical protein DL764_002350 [Monosporascus ibericus]